MAKKIIFDGYDDQYWYDEAVSYEKIKALFKEKSASGKVFVTGTLGRWNGVSSGCQLFNNFEEAFEFATDDCDLYKWFEEDGVLHLEASHHDGTNYVNFYLVNSDDFDDELEMLYAMVGINITERALNEGWISVPHFLSWLEENAE